MAEYHEIRRTITEYGGISRNIAEYHEIRRNITEYGRISRSMAEYHGIWWNVMEDLGVLDRAEKQFLVSYDKDSFG